MTSTPGLFFITADRDSVSAGGVIFLGLGYVPNSERKVFMRFGPLNL